MENNSLNSKSKSKMVESIGTPNRVMLGPNVYLGLRVIIGFGENIDHPILHPNVRNREYCLATWVDNPFEEFRTMPVLGLPNPVWNTECIILLNEFPHQDDCTFLKLEVMRINSVNDPGTSSGVVSVGKAMIPLPNQLYCRITAGLFGLVRTYGNEYQEEGYVALSMELRKYIYTQGGVLRGIYH